MTRILGLESSGLRRRVDPFDCVISGNLGNEAILVTKGDEVFSIGSNSSGCLGLGDLRSTLHPKRVDSLCNKRVKGIGKVELEEVNPHLRGGGVGNHFGKNHPQFTRPRFEPRSPRNQQSSSTRLARFSYGTGPHVVAYTKNGDLYSWGNNGYCELGNGTSNPCFVPTLIILPASKEVVDVACGSHHTLALTRDGEVYAWGQNNCGQVGSGMSTNQSAPRKVNSGIGGKKVVSIACGQTSSMAVVENGEVRVWYIMRSDLLNGSHGERRGESLVYGWGYNGNGQLGLGNTVNQLNPNRVTNLHGVVVTKIVCGYAHSMAVSDVGCLYVWGANSYGQLGTGNKTNISVPVQVGADIGRVVDIAATHYNHISAAITQNSKVYMWGQCRGQSVSAPFLTPFSRLHDVFACFATPSVMWRPMRVELDAGEKVSDALRNAFDDLVRHLVWGEQGPYMTQGDEGALESHPPPPLRRSPSWCLQKVSYHNKRIRDSKLENLIAMFVTVVSAVSDSDSSSDLTVTVQGKPIHVHKSLLKIRCQHFRSMFQDHWQEDTLR
uniref:(California timema) hypothetical protein n=1 Tax=Timema californicum TaxID=61474 RepID=A0A7R9PBE7_TIMCA|nr:unnamed protein product [Timema californicum]